MEKIIVSIFILGMLTAQQNISAQVGIGIGTPAPKALLHVETGAVLFSAPENFANIPDLFPEGGPGTRLMWYPKKAAFRAGNIIGLEWNKDSIGRYSAAFGSSNKAKGEASFAAGYYNHTIGDGSTAFGTGNVVTGNNSTAFGSNNEVTGKVITAIGSGLSVKSWNTVAIGRYNDDTDVFPSAMSARLFQIGNGNSPQSRNNALTVLYNGNTGIGELTPDAKFHIKDNSTTLIPHMIIEESENDFARLSFRNSSTPKMWTIAALPQVSNASAGMNFYYEGTGNILTVLGNGNAVLAGTLTQNSDLRLKTNIVALVNPMLALNKLSGYRYQWKESSRDSSTQIGLLAQEVQKCFPELVKEDEKGVLSVNYSGLIPVIITALKEQYIKVNALEKKVYMLMKNTRVASCN